jgi:hypothetical protein
VLLVDGEHIPGPLEFGISAAVLILELPQFNVHAFYADALPNLSQFLCHLLTLKDILRPPIFLEQAFDLLERQPRLTQRPCVLVAKHTQKIVDGVGSEASTVHGGDDRCVDPYLHESPQGELAVTQVIWSTRELACLFTARRA